MINERKAPKDWTTWADFANCYDLVLFNECTNLVHRENKSYDEGVINEWLEAHSVNCEAEHARHRLDEIDEDTEDDDEKKERQEILGEWGDCPECNCEPYQWYAIGVSEWDSEFLNKHFNLDIFYSDTLGIYILPVYHYGTAWSHVSLSMSKDIE